MGKHQNFVDTVDRVITDAARNGIMHLKTEDSELSDNSIRIGGKQVVNFGSCSYLGLEFDKRMIAASQQAVADYGTTFSSSRAYVATPYYEELEGLFDKIFDAHTVVTPTTTLGHMGVIPIVVECDDLIILDHQVHLSVQTGAQLMKAKGTRVELIRHNRMDILENLIKKEQNNYNRIWYMADGIYSMYGDATPVEDVYELMDKYPKLHYYVDDAHGMSCYGENGCGYVLSKRMIHDRMIFTTSLAKAFATGGAVMVFPDAETARKVRTCAASVVTSGPMQPATLAAAIASAKIHLSDEIYELQEQLHENIKYCNLLLRKHGLPVVTETDSPVFFVGVSLPKVGYNIIARMLNDGYYLNHGIFPAVPIKNTGVRFTITRLHSFEQIENMVKRLAYHLPQVLEEENFSIEKIYRAFKMSTPEEVTFEQSAKALFGRANLLIQHEKTIHEIDRDEWNGMLGDEGSFDWDGLDFLECTFSNNEKPENNWDFDYIVIRDLERRPIFATFLTLALNKDDMLAPAVVSAQIEEQRKEDPYYLVSKTLFMGSMLTEGNHLFADHTHPLAKEALTMLLDKINELQEKYEASNVILRDFPEGDVEMEDAAMNNGFVRTNMPDFHVLDSLSWTNAEDHIADMSKNSRTHWKRHILRHEDKFEFKVMDNPSEEELRHYYQLYLNVKEKGLELNTFTLPFKVFENMVVHKNWEIVELRLTPDVDTRDDRKAVIVSFNYKGPETYNPMIIGVDYEFSQYHGYRQAGYRMIRHASELGYSCIRMGFGATIEKKYFGASAYPTVAYLQVKDHFNMSVIEETNASVQISKQAVLK